MAEMLFTARQIVYICQFVDWKVLMLKIKGKVMRRTEEKDIGSILTEHDDSLNCCGGSQGGLGCFWYLCFVQMTRELVIREIARHPFKLPDTVYMPGHES
ncbi:hypothetical protein QN277_027832 [Acacia crassicarpa]|uniref:Uncharacterized protein n=1 Tax=Acacia crassicarpa TaxID=499986 RepID=A0AAE1K2L0_9FABA|nr:hypothetical protein QN277_027832 [Acacia crassicarpa]